LGSCSLAFELKGDSLLPTIYSRLSDMSIIRMGLILGILAAFGLTSRSQSVSTAYGTSYQVNVDAAGQNIPGDAANEPSLCVDPTHPERIAVGWRQFGSVTSAFRQAGWAYSTNGGLNWTFPGVLEGSLFRSDPVLVSDAQGRFYYLGVLTNGTGCGNYYCDLWTSTNGGQDWQALGQAFGGDKVWMAIDTTSGSGRGNLYQAWSPFFNYSCDPSKIFSRSTDRGNTWLDPMPIPNDPYFGTLDVGPDGQVYMIGFDGVQFWVNRSTNAWDTNATPLFDQTVVVDLGGDLVFGNSTVNADGLLGQPWVVVDRSSGATRGNVYALCSVSSNGNPTQVMFSRSIDGGQTWSAVRRLNDDVAYSNAYHWLGTLSVAPSGRIDACWNDTRGSPNNSTSQLYYCFSSDGGLTWSANYAVSPPFNHTTGFPGTPPQQKIGDYMGMVSLDNAPCIAYAATFNGEEDVYFLRVHLPITLSMARLGSTLRLTWTALPGATYCVQSTSGLDVPWSALGCPVATGTLASFDDSLDPGTARRFYRVVLQP
jgi:hypothetical protein